MNRKRAAVCLTAVAIAASSWAVKADIRVDEKNRVEFGGAMGKVMNLFGGKAAKEGVISTIAVQGDRKATMYEDRGQIIDLAEEKVYDLDLKKKTYKVTTFAELRRKMEEDRKKFEEQRKTQSREQQPEKDAKEMQVDFDMKETGQKKSLNGFDTKEVVMTISMHEKDKAIDQAGGMVMTTTMWMTSNIAAMQEIVTFDSRYQQKLAAPVMAGLSAEQMAMAMAQFPAMKEAMARAQAEGAKMSGTPILTTTSFDTVKSAEQMAQQKPSDDDPGSAQEGGGVGGMLGGFARRMGKKRAEGDEGTKAAAPSSRATFMTSTHEVLKVTPTVTSADVTIPAGFQQK